MKKLLILLSLSPFSIFCQLESSIIEPQYYSRTAINVKLSDIPKKDLHELAYVIKNYDETIHNEAFLNSIHIENYLKQREYKEDKEVLVTEDNTIIIIYSEVKFLENYHSKAAKANNIK